MAFYSLNLTRTLDKIPSEYLYIAIADYPKECAAKDGKKPTKEEKKQHAEQLEKHLETVKLFQTGYVNLYNNTIELESVYRNIAYFLFGEHSGTTYYKIKPIAARKIWDRYSSGEKYTVSEFSIVKQIKNPMDLVDDLCSEFYFTDLLVSVFDYARYSNRTDDVIKIFEYVHSNYPSCPVTIRDIIQIWDDTPRESFSSNSCSNQTKMALRKLVESGYILLRDKYDSIKSSLVSILILCGLEDVALKYIDAFSESDIANANWTKAEGAVRGAFTNDIVKKIAQKVGIKNVACKLIVHREDDDYYEKILEEVEFADIKDVKKYLVKKYDIDVDKLAGGSVFPISECIDDVLYEFKVE